MDRETFNLVKSKHGAYASWAVWAEPLVRPKSNMGDLSVLDPDQNPNLLQTLRTDVVMVGLNLSRSFPVSFGNFHDPTPNGQDFKIRYAFSGTEYYGAYMTDIVKGVVMLESSSLMRYLESDPSLVDENIRTLVEEFDDLQSSAPTVIAFGSDTYRLLVRHFPVQRYSRLLKVTHYSHYISKEEYRKRVLAELGE
jgi:hypothetical protein